MAKYVGFRQGKVHESHVISEYYCGGCGWPVTDHDSFCPECGGAFRECDASNLENENAKLKKLALEIWRSCPVSEDDCVKCPHYIDESEEVSCDIPILMEKLGVEVDA